MKAPVPPDENERLKALWQYDILDTAPEQEFDDLTYLASRICGTPISTISLIDEGRQWFKSCVGMTANETPRDVSFCTHTILENEILLIPDTHADERFAEHTFIVNDSHIRFYAGMPLVTPEGYAVGTLCVFDVVPRQLDVFQQDALRRLARQVVALMEARRDATQLKASEVRYRRLFEAAKDGILILDAATGEIEDANLFLCELLGYGPEEFIGQHLWEVRAFREVAANKDDFRLLQQKGDTRYNDLLILAKDGHSIYVEFVSNIYDCAGKKVIHCNVRDISAEKLAIAEQERFFTLSLDMLWILDMNGYFKRLNPAVEEVLGFTPDELVGQSALDYLHPEDRPASELALAQIAEGIPIADYVNRFRCRDGSYKSILWVTAHFGENFYAAGRDITGRVQAEETVQESQHFLQSTLDALSSHIAVLDEEGQIIAVNKAWRQFAQENDGTAISCEVGANYIEVCEQVKGNWTDAPALAQGIRQVIAGQQQSFCLEYPCHSTSERRWFNVSVTRFEGEGPIRVVLAHENITEPKQAEERLRQSEANLAKAQQIARLGSWELDLANTDNLTSIVRKSLRWSDEVFRIFGYQPGEIEVSSESFFLAVHPDDRERIRKAVSESFQNGTTYSLNHRILLPDGTERIVHEQSEIVFDERTGKPIKMVGAVQDITEQKQAEESLRQSSELLRAVTEGTTDAIFAKDLEGRYLMMNSAGASLLRGNVDEMLGKTDAEIFPLEVAETFEESDHSTIVSATNQTHEQTFTIGGVTYTFLSTKGPLLGPDGDVVGTVGIARDITERKQAEAQLHFQKTLLEAQTEASLDGILVVTTEGKILSYNQRFLQMWEVPEQFALTSTDNSLIQTIIDKLINPQQFLERVTYLYKHQDEHSNEEITLKDGRIFDRYSAPIVSADGYYYGRVWYFRDITERKQSETALRMSTERFGILSRATNDAVWDWNLLTNDLWWNEGFKNLFGYRRRDMESGVESWKSRLHPDDRERVIDGINTVINSGHQTWSDEYRFRRADGSYAEIFDRGFIILDENQVPVRMVGSMQDLTERKKVERALSESEERLKNILANVPGMVYQLIQHPDGSIEWPFVGKGCEDIFGMKPAAFQSNPSSLIEKVHPEDRAEYERSLLASEAMLPSDWTGRLCISPEETKWIQIASRPQRLEGDGTLWNGLIMDISERKREEEENARLHAEVEEQRQRTNNIVASVPGIVWETWVTPDGAAHGVDFVSDYVTQMVGYTPHDWLTTPNFWLTIVHPDDKEQAQREGYAIFSGGQGGTSQYRWITLDGRILWVESRMVVIRDEAGQPVGLRGVTIDITEMKRAEAALEEVNDELELRVEERTAQLQRANESLRIEGIERMMAMEALRMSTDALREAQQRLQVVMNHIPQAIFWKDRNSVYMGCNYRFAQDAGYTLPDELIGRSDKDMPWAQFADAYETDDRQVIDTDSPKLNIEEPMIKADGTPVWLRTNKIPLHDSENNVIGVLCSYEDISEQKLAEAAIHEARREADAANLAKSEFLSRMSHELRTPLNAILGFGQILDRQELTPIQRESTNYILKGGHHLLSLINEVLDIARIEAGHIELSIEPINLFDLVNESCALVRPLADEKQIQIRNDLTSLSDLHVMADRQRLKQVILNLLSNAIKYNREGGHVNISAVQVENQRIQLKVLDSGFGMSPQEARKLFTPFERLKAADTQIEGTGLGLVLSQRLVTAMDGTLGVESTLGEGSTFWVELPEAVVPLEGFDESLTRQPNEALRATGRTYNVLSIEDNLSNIRLLEAILENRPEITLQTAMQGSIGLDLARQHRPDLILLDLNLPGLSGGEVLAQLRNSEVTRDIPVIVISADATAKQIERLLSSGARAYLTKPIDVSQFLHVLDETLHLDDVPAKMDGEEVIE